MPTKPPTYDETTVPADLLAETLHFVQTSTPNPGHGFSLLAVALHRIYWDNYDMPDKSDDHLVEQFRIAIQSMRPETERLQ